MIDSEELIQYLYHLRAYGSRLGLERIQRVLNEIGNPDKSLKIIHVAGTNGKGSVCAMIEAILRGLGYKTGLYTSPHLMYVGERIQINRQNLQWGDFCEYVQKYRVWIDALWTNEPEYGPTFFEVMTAMAFDHFKRNQVDVTIVETGLGGRLDATNAVDAIVSVITSIGMDHMEFLGEDLKAIAYEKAGIIQENKPVVLGWLPREAEEVIREVASLKKAPVYSVKEYLGIDLSLYPQTNLKGDYQRKNAGISILVCEVIKNYFSKIKQDDASERMRSSLQSVHWLGRWQHIACKSEKSLYLDGAHNQESIQSIEPNILELRNEIQGEQIIFAIGCTADYRAKSILQVIGPHAKEIVFLEFEQERALSPNALLQYIPASFSGSLSTGAVTDIFNQKSCLLGRQGDVIIVTGSLYLVGQVLQRLNPSEETTGFDLQDRL